MPRLYKIQGVQRSSIWGCFAVGTSIGLAWSGSHHHQPPFPSPPPPPPDRLPPPQNSLAPAPCAWPRLCTSRLSGWVTWSLWPRSLSLGGTRAGSRRLLSQSGCGSPRPSTQTGAGRQRVGRRSTGILVFRRRQSYSAPEKALNL